MMPESASLISQFWIPPAQTFWRWDWDSARTASTTRIPNALWLEGSTLCLGEELDQVLEGLEASGVPPLSIILLVIAATRDDRSRFQDESELHVLSYWKEICQLSHDQTESITSGLSAIQRLPKRLRADTSAKTQILQCLFPRDVCHTPEATREILQARERFGLKTIADWPIAHDLEKSAREAWMMAETFRNLGPHHFRALLETGLNRTEAQSSFNHASQLVIPFHVMSPPVKQDGLQDNRMIHQGLAESPEFAGIARLIENLEAVFHLPKRLDDQSSNAVDGYSDLSNRGEPDRLLLSELAQDPELLSIRMSHGEALYLSRQSEPTALDSVRWILLDSGPWLWGRLRLGAAAVAMALSGSRNTSQKSRLLLMTSSGLTELRLKTMRDWWSYLESVTTSQRLHDHLALDPILTEALPQDDIFLISNTPVFSNRQTTLNLANRLPGSKFYSVELDRNGSIELASNTPRGRLGIKSIKLNWEKFFEENQGRSLTRSGSATLLPKFYQRSPFTPLYYSVKPSQLRHFETNQNSVRAAGILEDGSALYWNRTRRLGRMICRGLNVNENLNLHWDQERICWNQINSAGSLESWAWNPDKNLPPQKLSQLVGTVQPQSPDAVSEKLKEFPILNPAWSHDWNAVIRDHHGRIGLSGKDGQQRVFEFKTFLRHECRLVRTNANCVVLGHLTPWMGYEHLGLRLRHAELSNGVHVFMDQHGMLTLVHPQWQAPELTMLILTNRSLTAWASNEKWYGNRDFLWEESTGEVAEWDDLFHGYFDKA